MACCVDAPRPGRIWSRSSSFCASTPTSFELAEIQLDCAIGLYISGDYIPALTLAGAAEDLYGGPHGKPDAGWRDDPRAHKQAARDFNLVHTHLTGAEHERPWIPVNEIKNRLKHFDPEPLAFDAEGEAYAMIDRATRNRCLTCGSYHPRTAEVDAEHRKHREP